MRMEMNKDLYVIYVVGYWHCPTVGSMSPANFDEPILFAVVGILAVGHGSMFDHANLPKLVAPDCSDLNCEKLY